MDEIIDKILSSLKKERIIMYKMVEADENNDLLLFNALKKSYKKYMTETNEIIDILFKQNKYEEVIDILVNDIDINDEISNDKMTLISLLNTKQINKYSNILFNENADILLNKMVLLLYDIYIWNSNNYNADFKNVIRSDLLCDLTNSYSLRNYFGGNYCEAEKLSISKNEFDRKKLIKAYYKILNSRILVSNNLEILDGMIPDADLDSKKEIYKLWFSAISIEMMNNHIIIPVTDVEMSDFTREIIEDASEITNKYLSRKKEKVIKL